MSDQPKADNYLDAKLASMQGPSSDPDCLYHAITLTADDDLRVIFGTQSQWVGWTEDGRHEIRKSRLVYAAYATLWEKLGLPFCFVHNPDELLVFLVDGGNALVRQELAEGFFSNRSALSRQSTTVALAIRVQVFLIRRHFVALLHHDFECKYLNEMAAGAEFADDGLTTT